MVQEFIIMNNLPFVIWILGFPLLHSIQSYIKFLQTGVYVDADPSYSLFFFLIWIFVSFALYRLEDD
ncbi:hypothetical protein [Candidatus Vampirococcus lugosii]|uniref:hypothetical protein n=1 Tax=Candidatus Vampirococcus lugosii TaxID=2789015 RepID=UPI001BCCB7DD|nr:hypothetical protein [Candidatus Vampirococcus lugosii]